MFDWLFFTAFEKEEQRLEQDSNTRQAIVSVFELFISSRDKTIQSLELNTLETFTDALSSIKEGDTFSFETFRGLEITLTRKDNKLKVM